MLVRATVSLIAALTILNIVGAGATAVVAIYVVPEPKSLTDSGALMTDTVIAIVYGVVALVAGIAIGVRKLSSLAEWLPSERPPTPEQQLTVLRGPRGLARGIGALWFGGTVLFGALTIGRSVDGALRVMAIVGLGGVITSSVAFRLAERLLRESAARALSASEHPQRIAQSVAVRSIMTWVAGTGAPVLGVVLLGTASLVDDVGSRHDLALATAVLGVNCLVAGFITTVFVTRATADPIVSVRRALARIERGELDVSVPVYDGTDIGLLQAGFNRMAAGLREREQLRDLFGRHVGVDVARRALEQGVELGGEQRDVAVLYIDMVGSTTLAHELPASAVVELLNRFFGIVIDVVESSRGSINKFAGDAALAIFGAPAPLDDRRVSGFLFPSIGFSDKRGFDLTVPYYLNLAPNYDATLMPRLMTDRGLMLGGEFRYLTEGSRGVFNAEVMPSDSRADDEERAYGESLPGTRWWYQWVDQTAFGPDWNARVNLNRVSDDRYFEDFGRGLYTTAISLLPSSAYLNGHGDWWTASIGGDSYQITDPTLPGSYEPYRRLPRATFNIDKPLGGLFEAELDSEFVAFDKDKGLTGQRIDLYPHLDMPIEVSPDRHGDAGPPTDGPKLQPSAAQP